MQKRALYTGIAMLGLTSLAAAWIHDRQGEGLGGLVEATAVTRQAIPQHTAGKSATAIQASQAGAAAAHGAARHVRGDVDGDGKSDLLLDNISLGQAAYWRMDGRTPVAYSPTFTKPDGYAQAASGDFNGDGKLDIVWAGAGDRSLLMWVGDGSSFSQMPIRDFADGWAVTGAGDINGDGKSDLLLANAVQGLFAYWIMDGVAPTRYSTVFGQPAGHAQVATGDFNGDGRLDIVWDRASDRTLVMWLGDGNGFSQIPIRDYASGWAVTAAGDVDGDGKSDLLLANAQSRLLAYWTMIGSTPQQYSPVFSLPGETPLSGYSPATIGDYNGDGRLDLVLARAADRTLLLWQGDGNGFGQSPIREHAADWQVVRDYGARITLAKPYVHGDVDGNGKSDLLLFPITASAAGTYANVLMDGPRVVRFSALFYSEHPSYDCGRPAATGDFNGDGKLDYVFDRYCSGKGATFMRLSRGEAFTDVPIPTPAGSWYITGSGDIDGDGRSDLILHEVYFPFSTAVGGVAYWIMDGPVVSRFSPGFQRPLGYRYLLAEGDFDGDGRLDMVWGDGSYYQKLLMWRGNGHGFSELPIAQTVPESFEVQRAGDVDGDGRDDLIFLGYGAKLVYWIMQANVPVRHSPVFDLSPVYPRLATGDYNGDGKLDFVLSSSDTEPHAEPVPMKMWVGDGNGFSTHEIGAHHPAFFLLNPATPFALR